MNRACLRDVTRVRPFQWLSSNVPAYFTRFTVRDIKGSNNGTLNSSIEKHERGVMTLVSRVYMYRHFMFRLFMICVNPNS